MTGPGPTGPLDLEEVAWPRILDHVVEGGDLSEDTAHRVLDTIMAGDVPDAVTGALLAALRAKGESPGEVAGFVRGMLDNVARIDLEGPLVDTCGTGGDGADTFNVSTLVALVVAAAGCRVAKHGNRSASSACGSADLLEHVGVVIDLPPPAVATCVDELGIGFLYARTFHPAMRFVGPVRAALGIRSIFNVLGPLSNPADAAHQVVGVADRRLAPVVAEALSRLGKTHVLVFRGSDGLDELTTTGPSDLWEVRAGTVVQSTFDPLDVGIPRAELADLAGGDVERNAAIARAVLGGEPGPPADLVALNSGAALHAADRVGDIGSGVDQARAILASGRALDLLDRWVARSRELAA